MAVFKLILFKALEKSTCFHMVLPRPSSYDGEGNENYNRKIETLSTTWLFWL